MNDQAQSLREMVTSLDSNVSNQEGRTSARILTVSSGKGGVGKSNFTLNFALALKSMGKRVLLFDADIGMANLDVLMGIRPQYNLYHLLKGEKSISEIIANGSDSLPFIPGGSGVSELFTLSESDLNYFTTQVEQISHEMDYIIFDTGAGLSKETLKFITAADECFVVTTPEPTSITDAYALIKVVTGKEYDVKFQLVINRVTGQKEAEHVANNISLVAQRFLNVDIPMLGYICDDSHVMQAVKKQLPFSIAFPNCTASKDVHRLAKAYSEIRLEYQSETLRGIKGFMYKWLKRTK